jgi:hypothetical protein
MLVKARRVTGGVLACAVMPMTLGFVLARLGLRVGLAGVCLLLACAPPARAQTRTEEIATQQEERRGSLARSRCRRSRYATNAPRADVRGTRGGLFDQLETGKFFLFRPRAGTRWSARSAWRRIGLRRGTATTTASSRTWTGRRSVLVTGQPRADPRQIPPGRPDLSGSVI